ncbi:wat1-related protein at2g39510 [Phtheirospermum japonicum]|uniref:Wat1-related protein at2g39510 n=1 Tax=Phtheirospermum japonicum TaxID=374723 RepID=A0A830BK25_9LAMI|nr:wat1-related protein at2g39510 [Phtheirospermum japonicum]
MSETEEENEAEDIFSVEILDGFTKSEFWYVDQGIGAPEAIKSVSFQKAMQQQEEKWWLPVPRVPPGGLSESTRKRLNQKLECASHILKAASTINNSPLAEMDVPKSYLETLPKVTASTNKEVDSTLPKYPGLQPRLICQHHNYAMHVGEEKTTLGFLGLVCYCANKCHSVTLEHVLCWDEILSATFTSAMCNLIPALTFVLAWILRIEKVNLKTVRSHSKIMGTLVTVGGDMIMTLIVGPVIGLPWTHKSHDNNASTNVEDPVKGEIMIAIGCLGYSLFYTLHANTLKSYPEGLSLTSMVCSLGAFIGTIVTFLAERGSDIFRNNILFMRI